MHEDETISIKSLILEKANIKKMWLSKSEKEFSYASSLSERLLYAKQTLDYERKKEL